jgi:peptidyl-dipeptidase A
VQPLYEQLHCHVRASLNARYGDGVVPLNQPIRADLLGNMWAQSWGTLYDTAGPAESDPGYDLTALLREHNYDAVQMVRTGERFYTSLGLAPLPDTFWERSLFTRPADRDVVCHASAWDLDTLDDLRIKMCINIEAEDFRTVHHELGHNYYQRAYNQQPFLFRDDPNDGFHEAIGDFVALNVTPDYLVQIGLLDASQVPDASADTGLLMARALDKVSFLPFGYLMDQWRWKVFSGEITPENYNEAWWELRERIQGVRPPTDRPADAFDPGAKYHIANNVPYLRYFLAYMLQFQFYQAACEQAGWEGPLHRCTIYGNEEVGARFNAMMEMGASRPWPDALEAFTGTRQIDGSALVAYFQPLSVWLEEQNAERECGW